MKLDKDLILQRANALYAEAKQGPWNDYTAPELLPQIRSDQVKAVLTALIEAINASEV
jgi:hypothetical protein